MQADGLYELEKKANRGNAGDLFQPGQSLGPSNDPLAGPFPNTDSYQAGNLTQTGIKIHVGDFFLDHTQNDGSTGTHTDSTGLVRGRRLQQTAPAISFTLSATDGSQAAADGATLTPTGLPTISWHPSSLPTVTNSASPSTVPSSSPAVTSSDRPSTSPSLTDSDRPSTTPSSAPVVSDSDRPSSKPSGAPVHADSDRPSTTPSSAPVIADSYRPSTTPTGAPIIADSDRPSTTPTGAPVIADSYRPSSNPSGAPVILASSFPSSMPSTAATVTARAGDTITSVPSGQPSLMPSLLPDPYATNSSVCKESQMMAVDPFILRTVLLSIKTAGEFDVTVEYKGESDSMWNPFCHATSIVAQYPEYTLLPESSCTSLTILGGEQVRLRMTALPTASSSGGGTGGVIRRSLLGEQDMPPGYNRLDSMYNYQENECADAIP